MAYEEGNEAPPAETVRKGEGKMDAEELQSVMGALISDAVSYVDTELSPERAKAADYYNGEKFGNEEDGRSQIVLTEVRDAIAGATPDFLRVIFGAERVVEFKPKKPEQDAGAAQATDYAQYVFTEDNPGFLISLSAFKDGMIKRLGVVKWLWDASTSEESFALEGQTMEQLELLVGDEDVTLTSVEPEEQETPNAPDAPAEKTFRVEGKRKLDDGRVSLAAVPPDEFIFDRRAKSVDEAIIVGHRTHKTRGELIAMGISEKDIDEYGSSSPPLDDNPEQLARFQTALGTEQEAGEANGRILYVETYPKLDYDGDGVAELRQICTIGPTYHIVKNQLADRRPFAVFTPDPEPHAMIGSSWADRTMDMQLYKSSLFRAVSDSAALSIFPRTGALEGQVNMGDLLNTEIGAPIRVKGSSLANALQVFAHPFIGKEMLPILDTVDGIIERRTGQSKGALGLDSDALQSSTSSAVGAAITASQAQSEMLVRIFAETLLKPMFRGILRLLVAHQPRSRVVRLRGKWVDVDPRVWDADMDVTVNVALGAGLVEQKLARLEGIIEKQELILTTIGVQNPIVKLSQYANALRMATELSGFRDADLFFTAVDPNWAPPPTPPQPSPEMALAQIEAQKAQVAAAHKAQELQLKQQGQDADLAFKERQLQQEYVLKQQELEQQLMLKMRELELKYGVDLQLKQAEITLETTKHAQSLDLEREKHAHSLDLERDKAATQLALEEKKADMEHQRKSREAELKADAQVQAAKSKSQA